MYIFHKRILSKIYKELLQNNNKRQKKTQYKIIKRLKNILLKKGQ